MLFKCTPCAILKLVMINGVEMKALGKVKMTKNAVLLNSDEIPFK